MTHTVLRLLEHLARFGEENDAHEIARSKRMLNVTPDTGRLLWILTKSMGAARILEVGTSNGFSTIWLADAVHSGGRVTTLEIDPGKVALARANLVAAGLDCVVDIVEGSAAAAIRELPGPFDLIFLDADRSSYGAYLELALPKLRPGGMLIADNALSHAHELQDYLRRVKSHPQLFAVTVPIGNGQEIAVKIAHG